MAALGEALVALALVYALWRLAPISAALLIAGALTLLGTGAVDASALPFASQIGDIRASVQSWQQQQAHRGACYVRGMRALDAADDAALDAVAADCPPPPPGTP